MIHILQNKCAVTAPHTCPSAARQDLFETVRKLIRLIQGARREGLLWLESAAAEEPDIFLRAALRYIVEAAPEPAEFREYAAIWLLTTEAEAHRLLEMGLIADGLEQLLRQQTPAAALCRLGAWLGADFAEEIAAELSTMEQARRAQRRTARMEARESCNPAFDVLAALPEAQLTQLLTQADTHMLACALQGASGAVLRRAQAIATPALWAQLENEMDTSCCNPRVCDAVQAQEKILALLQASTM